MPEPGWEGSSPRSPAVVRRARLRTLALVAAGLVAVAVVARDLGPDREPSPELEVVEDPSPSPTPSRRARPAPSPGPSEAAGTWAGGATAPVPARIGAATAWTGREVLLVGGTVSVGDLAQEPAAEAVAYDPAADSWRTLPPPPLEPRRDPAWAWTGAELVVWGGITGDRLVADGAAYDPAADRWRSLAPSPLSPRGGSSAIWTGEEVLVIGGGNMNAGLADGAAYDPRADSWRPLAPAPAALGLPGAASFGGSPALAWTWTGRAAVLTPSFGFVRGEPPVFAYDVPGDVWSELPALARAGQVHGLLAGGLELYAYASSFNGESPVLYRLQPAGDRWERLPDPDGPAFLANGGPAVFDPAARRLWIAEATDDPGSVAVFDVATGTWERVPDRPQEVAPPLPDEESFSLPALELLWTGQELLVLEGRSPGPLLVSRWRPA